MPYPATTSDFPADSEERIDAALATAGTTAPVDTHIADWGKYDGDHTADAAALSFEHTETEEPFFQAVENVEDEKL